MKIKLTKEEREAVIKELAERIKDLVYFKAEDYAKTILEAFEKQGAYINPQDTLVVSYNLDLNLGFICQIIGNIRRKKDEKRKSKVLCSSDSR